MADINRSKKEIKSEEEITHCGFCFRHAFLIIFVLLMLLSLFSHNAKDLAIMDGGVQAPIFNWIGPAGAYISKTLLYLFGIAAYPLLIFLILCALRPLIPIEVKRKGYVSALIAVVIGTTIIFAMYPLQFSSITESLGIGHSHAPTSSLSGGVLGQIIAAPENSPSPGIVRHYIGTVGTFIVGAVFILSGSFFIWLADWKAIMQLRKRKEEKIVTKEEKVVPLQEEAELDIEVTPEQSEREKIREELRKSSEDRKLTQENEIEENIDIIPEEVIPKKVDAPAPPTTPNKVKKSSYPTVNEHSTYQLPPVSLLQKPKESTNTSETFVKQQKESLQVTLDSFRLDATVTGAVVGPRVTRYEITPEPGVKVEKITSISNNIAMDLQATSIRIQAPIPGLNAVGVEVPNPKSAAVSIREMMDSKEWNSSKGEIPVILGKNVTGNVVVMDLAKAPHLLIAGTTGSGKSVCMNTLIMSLLYHFTPDDLRLIMVDPKVVEFEIYKTIPHLIAPIVNDPQKVPIVLRWAINEMERRYKVLSKIGVRNLESFNKRPEDTEPVKDDDGNIIPQKLPMIVILIDELADIMMIAKADVETSIARIAQKARAVGIHMVLATQTPRKDIITGIIKANLPSRIAFRVGALIDSRVILDKKGAELLLGQGDMLFLPPGSADLDRIQGSWVSDDEIKTVVNFVADQAEQEFFNNVMTEENDEEEESASEESEMPVGINSKIINKYLKPDDDENLKKGLEIILMEKKASTSYIQRRLKIGYNKAADVIDQLEERGVIGPQPPTGGGNREILVDEELMP